MFGNIKERDSKLQVFWTFQELKSRIKTARRLGKNTAEVYIGDLSTKEQARLLKKIKEQGLWCSKAFSYATVELSKESN